MTADRTAGPTAAGAVAGAVAVVGLAGRFPGAGSVDELWQVVRDGRETLTRFDPAELAAAGVAGAGRPDYVPVRGVLDGVEYFDAALFGYPPREAELIDPQQRLLLECAWTALEHAGHAAGGRVGVFAGTSISTYLLHNLAGELAAGGDLLPLVLGNDKDHAAARIAYRLGLTGPALAVQTACSTSLVAVHQAVRSLRAGECDLALAGGAAVESPQRAGYVYSPEGSPPRTGTAGPSTSGPPAPWPAAGSRWWCCAGPRTRTPTATPCTR